MKGRLTALIQVNHLTKKYGDKVAVNDVSFHIEKGKIYGFLGPNGAGKSTTMNMITGCLCATSGTVLIDGYDIVKNPTEAKKHIGYLPEIPPLYPDMTPYEFLTFVAEAKGLDAEQTYRQVNEVISRTAIEDVADRLIGNLSKGYCQRVGIAQALLGNPDVVILDEPTVGLDPKQITEIRDLIRSLGKNNTVILSSHILAEISAVCDHIMILSNGLLVANDTPENLEQRMNENSKLCFLVKCEMEDGVRVLETVDGVEEYTVECIPARGCTEFSLSCDGSTLLQEKLFFAFAEAGLPIVHMATQRMTLEDIFLKLTTPQLEEENEEYEKDSLIDQSKLEKADQKEDGE